MQAQTDEWVFKPKGIVENREGLVAGFWIRHRKGHRQLFLLEKPIRRQKSVRIERRNLTINGVEYTDVPVEVYPMANSLSHWGK